MDIDKLIEGMFNRYWHGEEVLSSLDNMEIELFSILKCLVDGDWVGGSAHKIAVKGGFIIDGKSMQKKELTAFGLMFIGSMG